MSDLVMLMLEIAWRAYERGELSREDLIETMKKCTNLRAVENGYEQAFGMPCPEEKMT